MPPLRPLPGLRCEGILLLGALLSLVSAPALANNGGIYSYSGNPDTENGEICTFCHAGGVEPTVVLDGPSLVGGGETHLYTLSVSGGQEIACGLDVSADTGSLSALDADTRIWVEELTHNAPRFVDVDGRCVYSFQWTAPYEATTAMLYAAGNSVDFSGTTQGDSAAHAFLVVDVEGAPPGSIPPQADADGPHSGLVAEDILFDGSASTDSDGVIVAYDWDFGDGTTGLGVAPVHAYDAPGEYTVTLTVTDDHGFTGVGTTTVRIAEEAPPIRAIRIIRDVRLRGSVFVTAPRGDDRLFVAKQRRVDNMPKAAVYVVQDGAVLPDPLIEIEPVGETGAESGLRGIAFPPDFAQSGLFYVMYTDAVGDTVVVRYAVSEENPNVADPGSAELLLTLVQPTAAHNSSHLQFGPDGYLYIATGDGGDQNTPQDGSSLLGKMLRLDVSGGLGSGYSIPPSNPFVGPGPPLDEIWSMGFRNPYSFDFDDETHDLYIADVGQAQREEVNLEPAGSFPGRNYGWPYMEGSRCRGSQPECNEGFITLPIYEYTHEDGRCAIMGGSLYRGVIPGLQGRYFFAEWCTFQIWSLARGEGATVSDVKEHTDELIPDIGAVENITAIQPDGYGELIIQNRNEGELYRIISTEPDADGDFVPDSVDNCPMVYNRDQADSNGSGFGDVCEPECSDGIDNDGDGLIDYAGADIGCKTPFWPTESPECSDGIDNDGDGGVDWNGDGVLPPDPECGSPWQLKEAGSRCGMGHEAALLLVAVGWLRRRVASARRRVGSAP